MEVYILCGYEVYYPSGGLHDARALRPTLAEAKAAAEQQDEGWGVYEVWKVSETGYTQVATGSHSYTHGYTWDS